jgi:hypothetical protein
MKHRRLYLDMDGVLANFDKRAEAILGTNNIYKYEFIWGPEKFWTEINKHEDFFLSLELMPDAYELYTAVYHLDPVILTALPKTGAERVRSQKEAWVELNLSINGKVPKVIACKTHEKPLYCLPEDVLIDDRAVNRDAWRKAGGHYIVHRNASESLQQLEYLGVI